MLAIYQANPRAFEQNMNLLRSGAVLRIPDTADVAAVSPSEAAAEIRRQYAAFRANGSPAVASTGPSRGELKLVTPSGSASVGTNEGGVAGTEVKALQSRVHDLEGQLGESKRLLEMRNAELADLQSRLAAKSGAAPAPEPQPEPAQPPAAAAQPPVAETESPAAAPAPAPAEEPAAQSADTAAPAAAAPETIPPPKPPAPKAAPPVAESGSIFDTLKDFWWAGALLVAAIGGFIGFRMWRSRRESEFDDSLGRLAAVGASAVDRGFAAGDTSPMRPMGAAAPEGAFLVEESGSHERPRFGGGAAAAAPTAKHVATDDTISSETAINLDQGDPLAEADFHMAYGLYDQAADLIRIAISREPARRDLKLKLLEVFFVWGNKEQFLATAHELAETREESAPGEWEKIVIMGKQLAPDDPLFSGGAVGGASAGGVDLDLEGGQSRVDFDLLGEPVPGEAVGGDVDLDIGSALGDFDSTADATGATDRNSAIRGFGEGSTGTTRQMTARLPRNNDGLEGFGAENEGPTVEQPALTTPENPTIRQKVEMALKQSGAEQTAELAIDDLGLDLGALDTVDQPGFGASPDAPTLVAGMDERSRKVIEEAQRRAAEEQHASATGAWRLDESELEPALANGHDEAVEHGISETSRLSALAGGGDVDFDIGGATGAHHVANGAGLDLDVGTATMPDAAFTATQKISADDLALPDLEPVTMSEVGTKLDLARAYMDMGDPDGARNILEEVLHEGSVAQKQEAQRLMESLPG
jgi:pilus assembly protein FimV